MTELGRICAYLLADLTATWAIPEIPMRAHCYAGSGCWISIISGDIITTIWAFVVYWVSKSTWWTRSYALLSGIRIGTIRAYRHTFFADIVNKKRPTIIHTGPIIGWVLTIETVRTDIHAHFDIKVGISIELHIRGNSWTIWCANFIEGVSILICGAINSFYTMIIWIQKSIARTLRDTSAFDIGQSIVDKVISRACVNTATSRIKSIGVRLTIGQTLLSCVTEWFISHWASRTFCIIYIVHKVHFLLISS